MNNSALKILFPVDKNYQRSLRVVPVVQKMINSQECELHAVFVVEPSFSHGRYDTKLKAEVIKLGKLVLNQIKKQFNGVNFKGMILEGEPASEIVDYAHKIKADLIVMPTSGLCKTLLDSTTERVIRGSGLPVLTLYAPDGY